MSNKIILEEAIQNGIPCIPFIPYHDIHTSLSIIKPKGHEGYFITRIPALFPDGTIKYLYKEEFSLFRVVDGWTRGMKNQGRTYFFFGLYQKEPLPPKNKPFLDPRIFCQHDKSMLISIEFHDDIRFCRQLHSPLEVAFIYAAQNLKYGSDFRNDSLGIVNFMMLSSIYPQEESNDTSGIFEYYENWKIMNYPTSGMQLKEFMDACITKIKLGVKNE